MIKRHFLLLLLQSKIHMCVLGYEKKNAIRHQAKSGKYFNISVISILSLSIDLFFSFNRSSIFMTSSWFLWTLLLTVILLHIKKHYMSMLIFPIFTSSLCNCYLFFINPFLIHCSSFKTSYSKAIHVATINFD